MSDDAKTVAVSAETGNTEKNSSGAPQLDPYKWKPGQSGNPAGRPKKKWLTEVAEELLEERLSDPEFREAYKKAMWDKLISNRVVGAMTLDKVWERTEGKVLQPVELSGEVNIGIADRLKRAKERAK